jgi:DNA helicase-2/ATP-dependent DNA helicase PcrA
VTFVPCDKRLAIIGHDGHLLVTGGPGSGKTTVALMSAKQRRSLLGPGQRILFLSFSRAAVRQVLTRCKQILSRDERSCIEVQTYHAFCMEVLQAHGRLLSRRAARFLYPDAERLRHADFDGDWNVECRRLAREEGLFAFDLFGASVAELFERCSSACRLYADAYPVIILDEFQDTDDDQWRIVQALAPHTRIFALADPEQRIFDYRPNIDPLRLDSLREVIKPQEFDLGGENHRSPASDILSFANAVLRGRGPLPESKDVKLRPYYGANDFPATVHVAVVATLNTLRKRGINRPCLAVLCRTNQLVASVSGVLEEEHTYNNATLPPIAHDVLWDAELAAAAAHVVASIMEWPTDQEPSGVHRTLNLVARYHRLKNAEHPSKAAADAFRKAEAEAQRVLTPSARLRTKAAKELVAARAGWIAFVGDSVRDWRQARRLLWDIAPLRELYKEAQLVRLFGARDELATGLSDLWIAKGSYDGALDVVRRTLERQRLISTERDHEGCVLMNMHKSKGKEFDGVVLVEGTYAGQFLDAQREAPPYPYSRRLLRVAITRARTLVTIVRPRRALPLVDG